MGYCVLQNEDLNVGGSVDARVIIGRCELLISKVLFTWIINEAIRCI